MWSADGRPSDPGLAPGTMVGEYRVEQLVGEGGMGQVYGAIHPVIGKRAAIKVLLPEICRNRSVVERFVMEARAVNQIGHPNIVDVFAFGALPDGRQYMVMEWLKGEALSDRLARGVPSLHETCDILLGIAAALDAAHDKGIVHRDLKPHNVFLVDVKGARPLVKLLDFGLVKLSGPDDHRIHRTQSGSLLGTPAYMSPEQALGREVDTRSDNYSLGVLAFEMLTGRLPFLDESPMALLVAHMQQPPSPPSSVAPNIPPQLDQLVFALLAKDPAHRPTLAQTIEILTYFRDITSGRASGPVVPPNFAPTIHASRAAVSTVGGHGVGEALIHARREPSRINWKLAALLVVVVTVAAIVVVIFVKPSSQEPQQAATPPPAAIDAALAGTPVDAAVAAAPVDAAVAAAPLDAGIAIDAAVVAKDEPKPKKKKVTPKPPTTTTSPKPPVDDDGLIQVTPKKN